MAMGGFIVKRNATMFMVGVLMVVVVATAAASATEGMDEESESFELIIHSSKGSGLEKLHACCPSAITWNCYRVCRFKGNQATCARYCDCKLGEEITPDCYRLNIPSSKDQSPTVRKESLFEERVPNKLHACCENAQRWNCYRICRLGVGSQQQCANYCSCVLVEKLTPKCYRSSMDAALLMMTAESDDQELKE